MITSLKPTNFEGLVFSVIKQVLLANISSARNILIRLPLKLFIIVLALVIKLIFGSLLKSNTNNINSTKKEPNKSTTRSANKSTRQSSPSSISVVLSTASDDMSVQRKSVSSRLDFGNKTSTYSMIKSVSKSSLVNFFTPDYSFNECLDDKFSFSDINSVKTTNTELIQKELLLNETDLDCDSLESSFYYDLKTHFSEKNLALNSSFTPSDEVSFV